MIQTFRLSAPRQPADRVQADPWFLQTDAEISVGFAPDPAIYNNNNNNDNDDDKTAEVAASRKENKYADLDSRYLFEPIAVIIIISFISGTWPIYTQNT